MANRTKILFIVEAMGGVFTYIVDLGNELANMTDENGSCIYDMYIAYRIRKQTPKDYKRYFDKKIRMIQVESFGRAINVWKDVKAFFEIGRIANKVEPDIIHLHSSKAGALGCAAFNRYKGEHEETLKLNKRAVYVNNGINVNELEKNIGKIKVMDHPFTVFTLGRICYQKNPASFNQIAEAMPDVKFLWIGDGELREVLMSKNIEITGWVDRMTALEKSMTADVFMLTNLWGGVPISLREVMYMKKPCEVSNVIGDCDVIHNNENRFVCDGSDGFAESVRKIQRDMKGYSFESVTGAAAVYLKAVVSGRTEKLVNKAYEDVMEKYNTTVMARSYAKIYGGIYSALIGLTLSSFTRIVLKKVVA